MSAKCRFPESRGRGQTCQGPWGTRWSNGALRRPTTHIALPRSDAGVDIKSTMGERETHALIASEGPWRRAIAHLRATVDAQAAVPIRLTFLDLSGRKR